jgi:hypothetical protein
MTICMETYAVTGEQFHGLARGHTCQTTCEKKVTNTVAKLFKTC